MAEEFEGEAVEIDVNLTEVRASKYQVSRVTCEDCGDTNIHLILYPSDLALLMGAAALDITFPPEAIPDLLDDFRAAWNSRETEGRPDTLEDGTTVTMIKSEPKQIVFHNHEE